MKPSEIIAYAGIAAGLIVAATVAIAILDQAGAGRRRSAADAGARRLLLCQRQDDDGRRQGLCQPSDVCRGAHPGEADAPLSDRHGARRHHVGHQLHRHARRPRRLGAIFRAPRLCGLCGRSARPGAVRLSRRGLRADAQCRTRQCVVALRRPGKVQAVAAGGAAHPMAGQRRARRSGDGAACRQPDAGDRRFRLAAIPQSRCAAGAASKRSARRSC